MRINHNVLALNAWRNLNQTNDQLSSSLEKLSSGYRINRAADDPAGLVISEKLRAEITGVSQAVNNTQDAVSMVQVAEGALVEINTMLNSMRALALHAANTGASSTDAIAADQQQIDSAVNSIQSIASNTSFLGRNLLNGSSGNTGTVLDTAKVATVTVGNTAVAGANTINAQVTTSAAQALLSLSVGVSTSSGVTIAGTISVNGYAINVVSGSVASTVTSIQNQLTAAGQNIKVSTGVNGNLSYFTFTTTSYGSAAHVNVVDASNTLSSGAAAAGYSAVGVDVAGTINGSTASGAGLTLTAGTGTNYAGTAVTLTAAGNAVATITNAVTITGGAVTFQIGAGGTETQVVSLSDVSPNKLGTTASTGGLNDIKTSGQYNLSANPTKALEVIDAAIKDISNFRANLGALTKNVFETKIRSLQVSEENLTASESRIRDVDMSKEMMEFTRNQIMMQAGTSMLAQANSAPQAVLKLLQ